MREAILEAKKAGQHNEVPVGAVIVYKNQIIAKGYNKMLTTNNPTAHAEMVVIQEAALYRKTNYLNECDIYVTLEPCPMCAYAISLSRISRLYFAAYDEKSGGVENGPCIYHHKSSHHKPEVYSGIMELEASKLMKNFFLQKRSSNKHLF